MSEECTHDCKSCGSDCGERQAPKLNGQSSVKKVYAVMSGKGGVGKSAVTARLACEMARRGFKTAILDADVIGPSIPKMFGTNRNAESDENGLYPVESRNGIKLMSVNLLLPDETEPVVWRGPVISGIVTQFWTDVVWGDVDYMFVDMPPGTGDVPLTIYQTLPVDGIIIVSSPQELVAMVVEKALKMAEKMSMPVLGIVENMSWYECPECGEKLYVFGRGRTEDTAQRHGVRFLGRLPIDPKFAEACDAGMIESYPGAAVSSMADML